MSLNYISSFAQRDALLLYLIPDETMVKGLENVDGIPNASAGGVFRCSSFFMCNCSVSRELCADGQ